MILIFVKGSANEPVGASKSGLLSGQRCQCPKAPRSPSGILVMDGWLDGWMDGWMDGWTDGRTDGRMDGWMDGWTDGRMDGWMAACLFLS